MGIHGRSGRNYISPFPNSPRGGGDGPTEWRVVVNRGAVSGEIPFTCRNFRPSPIKYIPSQHSCYIGIPAFSLAEVTMAAPVYIGVVYSELLLGRCTRTPVGIYKALIRGMLPQGRPQRIQIETGYTTPRCAFSDAHGIYIIAPSRMGAPSGQRWFIRYCNTYRNYNK